MRGSRYHNDQLDQEPIAYRIFELNLFSRQVEFLKTNRIVSESITKVIGLPVIFMKNAPKSQTIVETSIVEDSNRNKKSWIEIIIIDKIREILELQGNPCGTLELGS